MTTDCKRWETEEEHDEGYPMLENEACQDEIADAILPLQYSGRWICDVEDEKEIANDVN